MSSQYATPSQVGVRPSAALSAAFLSQSFLWMFLGLGLTAGVGVLIGNMSNAQVASLSGLAIPLLIGQLIVGFTLGLAIRKISATVAVLLFFVYAATMGISVGFALRYYDLGSVATAAGSAAVMFGGAAIYGKVTNRNLASMGGYLFMGLLGLIAAMFLNYFVGWDWLNFGISVAGVVIFTGLTAWDVQRISRGDIAAFAGSMEKGAIYGAFALYLDFINLFFMLLRLFGSTR